ncbi:MAG TPA: hypothetical protein VIP57_06615 [Candidatus Dormibacteraeota bacterium]
MWQALGAADLVGDVCSGPDLATLDAIIGREQGDKHVGALQEVLNLCFGLRSSLCWMRHLFDQDRLHPKRLDVVAERHRDLIFVL